MFATTACLLYLSASDDEKSLSYRPTPPVTDDATVGFPYYKKFSTSLTTQWVEINPTFSLWTSVFCPLMVLHWRH